MKLYSASLPFPPSVNHAWKKNRNQTSNFKSAAYKAWERQAMLLAPSCLTIQVPVRIAYTFFMPDKRTRDIGNYEKVVTDLLVTRGVIPDDDITHIKEINLRFGGFDRQNPRVDLEVYPA